MAVFRIGTFNGNRPRLRTSALPAAGLLAVSAGNFTRKRDFAVRPLAFSLQSGKTVPMTGRSGRARYASTVVVVRPDERGGFEILLTCRPRQMKFLGGFYVFPGGSVHRDDYSKTVLKRCRGLSSAEARRILGDSLEPELSLGHWVAGIRELFEEVGVLLCVSETGAQIDLRDTATRDRLEQQRQALVRETLDFGTFLESEGLLCDLARPIYFYHRVTPEIYPIRFDTRFYLASLPADQVALDRSEEVTRSIWIKPGEALLQAQRDEFPLIPPTTFVLDELAGIVTWDELRLKYRLG